MSAHSLVPCAHFIHTHIWLKFEPCPHSTHDHHHGHPCGCCLVDLTFSFYLFAFLLSVFLFSFFHLSDEQQPGLNKKIMENLCDSATNGGEGTYDVLYLSTFSTCRRLRPGCASSHIVLVVAHRLCTFFRDSPLLL